VLKEKADLTKCNLDVIKPWMARRITEILGGIEDDVVIEYAFSLLEDKNPCPRQMQINLTGFLNAKRSREFMAELWQMLLAAQKTVDGIPPQLVNEKIQQLKKAAEEQALPLRRRNPDEQRPGRRRDDTEPRRREDDDARRKQNDDRRRRVTPPPFRRRSVRVLEVAVVKDDVNGRHRLTATELDRAYRRVNVVGRLT